MYERKGCWQAPETFPTLVLTRSGSKGFSQPSCGKGTPSFKQIKAIEVQTVFQVKFEAGRQTINPH
jgi:hypothetical protein